MNPNRDVFIVDVGMRWTPDCICGRQRVVMRPVCPNTKRPRTGNTSGSTRANKRA
jgi:hypothetical protein